MIDVEDSSIVSAHNTALHFATLAMIDVRQMEHIKAVVRALNLQNRPREREKSELVFRMHSERCELKLIPLVAASTDDRQMINCWM